MNGYRKECYPSGANLKKVEKVHVDLMPIESVNVPLVAKTEAMEEIATYPFVKREFEDFTPKYKRLPDSVKVGDQLPKTPEITIADYCTRKYETLLGLENNPSVNGYFENMECGLVNPRIQVKHRCILMDWVVDVVHSFRLNMETLYYSIRIIDQYMSHVTVKTAKLQLVAVAAIHVRVVLN